jgi:cytoskeletal protein CcmA (bactofilin family)
LAVFGKTEPNRAPPDSATPAIPVPTTILGPGARFVGDLSGDEDVVVNGRFEGKIKVEKNVMVGAGGELEGDIAARSVVVGGRVRGQITAGEKAELLGSAVVEGSVLAPKIVIAEGAQIEGNVAMSGSRGESKEK